MEISNHGKHLNLPSPKMLSSDSLNGEGVEVRQHGMKYEIEDSQAGRLIDRLQGNSDVRNRLLVEIKAKVMAGEYNTRVSIERAAERMIDS